MNIKYLLNTENAEMHREIDQKPKRSPGALKGKIKIAKDFDASLPEDIFSDFEGVPFRKKGSRKNVSIKRRSGVFVQGV